MGKLYLRGARAEAVCTPRIGPPIPYSLFPTPYSLFPTPYSLLPIPYSLSRSFVTDKPLQPSPRPVILNARPIVRSYGQRGRDG